MIRQAVGEGADLLVFGETCFCGYPAWLDSCQEAALWEAPVTRDLFARMHQQALSIESEGFAQLQTLAKKHEVELVFGANEKVVSGPGQGSLFNSLFIIDRKGSMVLHHRKFMPTFTEKLLYALGDAEGLHSVSTHWGKLSALICWEHWMLLTRQALHDSGEHIHIALWPAVKDIHQLASRHYATGGRCYVIAVGQIL